MDFTFITNNINTQDLVTSLIVSAICGLCYIGWKVIKPKSNQVAITNDLQLSTQEAPILSVNPNVQPPISKQDFSILFIDDDTELKMAENIKTEWANTKVITDSNNIKQFEIRNADVIFVDIQGVGIALGFTDEGLGLAKAIKQNYRDKKVVIYSAAKKHDIYHDAIQICDKVLKKDANLYEFNNLIEKYYEEKIAK